MLARLKVPILLAVAALAMGWLVASGVSRNDLYMSTLDQWDPVRARKESVRLMGFVAEGSMAEDGQRLVTAFRMRNEAGDRTVPVSYQGVLPDLFRDGASVIASGRLREDGVFAATDLMTKCPSKYEGVDVPHGPEGEPLAAEARAPAATALR